MRTSHRLWPACATAYTLTFGLTLSPVWSQGMTMTCQFLTGPRAGQAQSYAGVPGVNPIAIGAPCTDLYGSYGVGIADSYGSVPSGMTLTCQFTSGPRAGQAQSYVGVAGVSPISIGSPCSDLQGSYGFGK